MKSSDFTILFAEDNPDIRRIYEKAFTQEGYKVVVCEHAVRAMAELHDQKIDLFVTDLEMPEMNTLDLLTMLKRDYPRLPVVVVSGHYKDLEKDFTNRDYSITAFLTKPVGLSVLKEKVREILGLAPGSKK